MRKRYLKQNCKNKDKLSHSYMCVLTVDMRVTCKNRTSMETLASNLQVQNTIRKGLPSFNVLSDI